MSAFLLREFEYSRNRDSENWRVIGFETARIGSFENSRLCDNERFNVGGKADSLVAYK